MTFLQKKQLLFLICLFFFCNACHDKEALRQAMIEKIVKEKVDSYKRKKTTTCNKTILEEAVEIADSIMIHTALHQVDTSSEITRPIKPVRPDILLPVDTSPIRPLFID